MQEPGGRGSETGDGGQVRWFISRLTGSDTLHGVACIRCTPLSLSIWSPPLEATQQLDEGEKLTAINRAHIARCIERVFPTALAEWPKHPKALISAMEAAILVVKNASQYAAPLHTPVVEKTISVLGDINGYASAEDHAELANVAYMIEKAMYCAQENDKHSSSHAHNSVTAAIEVGDRYIMQLSEQALHKSTDYIRDIAAHTGVGSKRHSRAGPRLVPSPKGAY